MRKKTYHALSERFALPMYAQAWQTEVEFEVESGVSVDMRIGLSGLTKSIYPFHQPLILPRQRASRFIRWRGKHTLLCIKTPPLTLSHSLSTCLGNLFP